MKTKNLIIFLFVLFIFTGCKKSETNIVATNPLSLIGKWRLTEVYSDPGDGSGKFVKVNNNKTIEFTSNKLMKSENGNLCNINIFSEASERSAYTIKTVEAYGVKPSISIEKCKTEVFFDIKENELILYYSCIEGCGEKFVRVD